MALDVVAVVVLLERSGVPHLVVLAHRVHRLRLEEQEPSADRPVSVLETCGYEAVLHQGELGPDLGRHRVGGARVPHRIPGPARALPHRTGPEHVHRAPRRHQAALEPVDMELVVPHAEPGRPRDPARVVLVGNETDDEAALQDVLQAERLLRALGDDPFVGLAVDHDLPPARAYRLAAFRQGLALVAGLLPDRKPPLLEIVDRVVDVPADVVDQVLAGDAHEILPNIAHVIGRIVVAHVGVDGGESLGHRPGAVHRRLVHELDLDVDALLPRLLDPAHDLEAGPARGHAASDEQDVDLFLDDLGLGERIVFAHGLPRTAPAAVLRLRPDAGAHRVRTGRPQASRNWLRSHVCVSLVKRV